MCISLGLHPVCLVWSGSLSFFFSRIVDVGGKGWLPVVRILERVNRFVGSLLDVVWNETLGSESRWRFLNAVMAV